MKTDLIKNIKLPRIAEKHPVAFWTAIVLHVALVIGLVFSNVQRWEIPKQAPKSSSAIPKAVTIDLTEIKKEKQRLVDIKQKREKRLAELKRAEKRVENERYKEQQRLKKLKAKVKKENQAQAEAEKNRKDVEQKIKQALKQKKLAEKKARIAEKRKKLAEKEAKKAEQETQKIEKRRNIETNKFEKEQDTRALKKEIQAEEDQEREIALEDNLNKLKVSYMNRIQSKVRDKWRYNKGIPDHWGCDVHILQNLNGKVQSVNIQSCNIDNNVKAKAFKDAIERAVYKASPLPQAPDKSVFDREILFHFRIN
jgi:colicin import membrane protein